MNIFFVSLLSFLPKKYRNGITSQEIPARGAVLGGVVEFATGAFLLLRGYSPFMQTQLASVPLSVAVEAGKQGGESAFMGLGSIFMLAYFAQPVSLALLFLVFEGGCRVIAAFLTGEVVGSLPFYFICLLHTRLGYWHRESQMGRRVPDQVQSTPGEGLQISSSRPKSWTPLTTIAYQGILYELESAKSGTSPRQFIYLLRKKPLSAVIRGLYEYDPNEVLN
jgi:hypothetical protein